MATVVNVPRDTRFGELGDAINQGLDTFLSRRKEVREKDQRDDELAQLMMDLKSGKITQDAFSTGVIKAFPAGQENAAIAFINSAEQSRLGGRRLDLTERDIGIREELGFKGLDVQREGLGVQSEIAKARDVTSRFTAELRAKTALQVEGLRQTGRIRAAEITALNKTVEISFFNSKTGAEEKRRVPEWITAGGITKIKEYLESKEVNDPISEGFDRVDPRVTGLAAARLELFHEFTKNIDFKKMTPEVRAQWIANANLFLTNMLDSRTMQTFLIQKLEETGVVSPADIQTARMLEAREVLSNLSTGKEVSIEAFKRSVDNMSVEDLIGILQREGFQNHPQRVEIEDVIQEQINKVKSLRTKK